MQARQFLIVTTARSGSNQLVDYINQLPRAKCFGEIFKWNFPLEEDWTLIASHFESDYEAKKCHEQNLSEYWIKIVGAASADTDWVGAKLFYEHCAGDALWSKLGDENLTIIHLYRPRVMDLYLSLLRAEATGVWMAVDKSQLPVDPQIEFSEERYIKYRDYTRSRFAQIKESLGTKRNYCEINYEDISNLEVMTSTLNIIFGRKTELKQTLIKQSKFSDNRMIKHADVAAKYADDLIS